MTICHVPVDRKAPARKLDDWNWKKEKEQNYRWGNYSVIEEDYKEEKKSERRYERRKDKSFPDRSDRKENSSRSRKILDDALRDVNASARKPERGKPQAKDVDAKGRALKNRKDIVRKNVRSDESKGWSAPKKRNKT